VPELAPRDTLPEVPDVPNFEIWLAMVVVMFVLFPLNFAWYKAALYNQMALCTSFGNLRFEFTGTGLGIFWLQLVNNFIVLITLGLGVPFAQRRKFSYVCRHLLVAGEFDLNMIRQNPERAGSRGEGLADALDLGEI